MSAANLQDFIDAYVTCMLWAETDNAKDCEACGGTGECPHEPDPEVAGACKVQPCDDVCAACHGCGRVPDEDSSGGDPFDSHFDADDIHPDSMKEIKKECEQFVETYGVPNYNSDSEYTDQQRAGHDFWLTRNGHGTGFWARGELTEEDQTKYTKAAKSFGSCDVYLGDDGKLHVS